MRFNIDENANVLAICSVASKLFESAKRKLLFDHHKEAAELFSDSLRINPDNALAWTYQANCYKQMGMYSLSLEASLKSIKLDPRVNQHTYIRILQLHLIFGDLSRANLTIEELEKLFPRVKHPTLAQEVNRLRELEALNLQIDESLEKDNFEAALDLITKALVISPKCIHYVNLKQSCQLELACISPEKSKPETLSETPNYTEDFEEFLDNSNKLFHNEEFVIGLSENSDAEQVFCDVVDLTEGIDTGADKTQSVCEETIINTGKDLRQLGKLHETEAPAEEKGKHDPFELVCLSDFEEVGVEGNEDSNDPLKLTKAKTTDKFAASSVEKYPQISMKRVPNATRKDSTDAKESEPKKHKTFPQKIVIINPCSFIPRLTSTPKKRPSDTDLREAESSPKMMKCLRSQSKIHLCKMSFNDSNQ